MLETQTEKYRADLLKRPYKQIKKLSWNAKRVEGKHKTRERWEQEIAKLFPNL